MQIAKSDSWATCVDESLGQAHDSHKNQEFLRVIDQLKDALSKNCVAKHLETSYEKLNGEYAAKKRKYLKIKLLYDALYDSARDRLRVSMDSGSLDTTLQRVEAELHEREFDEAAAGDSVLNCADEVDHLRKTVSGEVEHRVAKLFAAVGRFHAAVSGNLQHADCTTTWINLPKLSHDFAKLRAEQDAAQRDEAELKQIRSETQSLRSRREVLQRRYIDVLNSVVQEHGGTHDTQLTVLQSSQMETGVARCEALAAKISLIQQRVINATYDDDRALAALKEIRLVLDAEVLKLESEIRRMQDALQRYSENERVFQALAEEQRRLKKQIGELEPTIAKLSL